MSHSPAIGIFKPLRLQMVLRETKSKFADYGLVDDDDLDLDLPNFAELVRLLDPPLERIIVTRLLKRYLPVLTIHPQVPQGSRVKALELLLKKRRRLSPKQFLRIYEEYFDRESVKEYLKREYPAEASFGMFSKSDLLSTEVASTLKQIIFDQKGIRLKDVFSVTDLKQKSRLSCEILSLQYEKPSLGWLKKADSDDLDALFAFYTRNAMRFRYFEKWLRRLCGPLPQPRRKIKVCSPAQALIEAFTETGRMGDPFVAEQRWEAASQELRQTVKLALFERELGAFMSADKDSTRFDFWKRYGDICQGFQRFAASNAFALRIGDLWFVEFEGTGSCYIYTDHDYTDIVRKSHGRELKWPNRVVKKSTWVTNANGQDTILQPPLRHVHRGTRRSYTWQQQFDEFIRKHAL